VTSPSWALGEGIQAKCLSRETGRRHVPGQMMPIFASPVPADCQTSQV